MPTISFAAVITLAAILLIPLFVLVHREVNQRRQNRKATSWGLIPVPAFEDTTQEELGPGVEYVSHHPSSFNPYQTALRAYVTITASSLSMDSDQILVNRGRLCQRQRQTMRVSTNRAINRSTGSRIFWQTT